MPRIPIDPAKRMDPPTLDQTGNVFGMLKVLGFHGRDKYGRVQYDVKCECGTEVVLYSHLLLRRSVRDCGCQSSTRGKVENAIHLVSTFDYATSPLRTDVWKEYIDAKCLIGKEVPESEEAKQMRKWDTARRRCEVILSSDASATKKKAARLKLNSLLRERK